MNKARVNDTALQRFRPLASFHNWRREIINSLTSSFSAYKFLSLFATPVSARSPSDLLQLSTVAEKYKSKTRVVFC